MNITETYTRVIPRDFFNESKLLKCMGQLALKILDCQTPCEITIEDCGDAFNIELSDEGSLFVSNYPVSIKGIIYMFKTTYNSKSPFPFYCEHNYIDYAVFDEVGNFHQDFIDFVNSL
jgi:hypothetical protein